jgi:F-type H+-transporting ATPase subunit gamma
LLSPGPEGNVNVVVITSDRGLCGGFNSALVQEALRVEREDFAGQTVRFTAVGRKGTEALRRRGRNVRNAYTQVMETNPMRSAVEIVEDQVADYMTGQVGGVYCLYNEFKSAMSQTLTLEKLLPFEAERTGEVVVDYVYEPSQAAVLQELLTRHLHIQMHRILFESAASEHGARMTAMDSATNNAEDVIDRLTLQYNRARQTAITTEVIEIVSGAEAL